MIWAFWAVPLSSSPSTYLELVSKHSDKAAIASGTTIAASPIPRRCLRHRLRIVSLRLPAPAPISLLAEVLKPALEVAVLVFEEDEDGVGVAEGLEGVVAGGVGLDGEVVLFGRGQGEALGVVGFEFGQVGLLPGRVKLGGAGLVDLREAMPVCSISLVISRDGMSSVRIGIVIHVVSLVWMAR